MLTAIPKSFATFTAALGNPQNRRLLQPKSKSRWLGTWSEVPNSIRDATDSLIRVLEGVGNNILVEGTFQSLLTALFTAEVIRKGEERTISVRQEQVDGEECERWRRRKSQRRNPRGLQLAPASPWMLIKALKMSLIRPTLDLEHFLARTTPVSRRCWSSRRVSRSSPLPKHNIVVGSRHSPLSADYRNNRNIHGSLLRMTGLWKQEICTVIDLLRRDEQEC